MQVREGDKKQTLIKIRNQLGGIDIRVLDNTLPALATLKY